MPPLPLTPLIIAAVFHSLSAKSVVVDKVPHAGIVSGVHRTLFIPN